MELLHTCAQSYFRLYSLRLAVFLLKLQYAVAYAARVRLPTPHRLHSASPEAWKPRPAYRPDRYVKEHPYNTISPLDWQASKLTKTAACDFAPETPPRLFPARRFGPRSKQIWPTGKRHSALGDFNSVLRRKRRENEAISDPKRGHFLPQNSLVLATLNDRFATLMFSRLLLKNANIIPHIAAQRPSANSTTASISWFA